MILRIHTMCLSSCSKYHEILGHYILPGWQTRGGRKGIYSSMIEPQLLLLSDSLSEQIMKVTQRMSPLGMLAFAVVAVGVLAFISGAPLASVTPVLAQETTNATTTDTTTTTTNATSPETEATPEGGGTETPPPAMTEEQGQESTAGETHQDTFTVRDSVFALLADQTIPASGFIHLYDTTPYSIISGHVAAKIPCDDESAPLLNILVGAAPQFTPAPLELIANLSTAGELCLYHVDLPAPGPEQQANTTNTTTTAAANTTTAAIITDIAIQNPGDEDITLPSTSTVVIGINEIEKGAHTHEEGEGGEQPPAGTP